MFLKNLTLTVLFPTDFISQFVSTRSCSADVRTMLEKVITLFIKTQPRGLLHTLNTDTVTYKETSGFFFSLRHEVTVAYTL